MTQAFRPLLAVLLLSESSFPTARWRVNGPLVDTPAFSQTFACTPGQPMFRSDKDRLAIWR